MKKHMQEVFSKDVMSILWKQDSNPEPHTPKPVTYH